MELDKAVKRVEFLLNVRLDSPYWTPQLGKTREEHDAALEALRTLVTYVKVRALPHPA
jgi:hypothetical protein